MIENNVISVILLSNLKTNICGRKSAKPSQDSIILAIQILNPKLQLAYEVELLFNMQVYDFTSIMIALMALQA